MVEHAIKSFFGFFLLQLACNAIFAEKREMIQRIQSLFLLLAAGSYGSLFGLPFVTSDNPAEGFFSNKSFEIQDHMVLSGLVITGAFFAIMAIFLFKNRKAQVLLSYLSLLTGLIFLPGIGYYFLNNELPESTGMSELNIAAGLFIPVVIAVLLLLAVRNIKKDDKLVRSMDRLR